MNIIALHPLPHAVRATVSVPGSKSLTNRALIIAALTPSVVVIHHPLVSDDTRAMAECLTRLGIRVQQKKNKWIVHGGIQQIRASARVLNAGLSGTTMRFLTALACIIPGITILSGEQGLNARPIGDLVSALQKRGASIGYLKKPGFPPIRVREQRLKPGVITINGTTSSQFISALLMMLPVIGRTKVAVSGKPVSRSYIDMTVDFMRQCGVRVRETRPNHFEAPEGPYTCRHIHVENDASSACYFAAIAALTKSTITINGMHADSVQPDTRFISILSHMGNKVLTKKDAITVRGSGVRPLSIDMGDCPDQIQTLAVLAAFARGKTVIRGIQTLRVKETDRVRAIRTELVRMGIQTSATKNNLVIFGGQPRSARIHTHGDHRMAMAFAVAGAKIPGIQIENPEIVNKTFPLFWKCLADIGVTTKRLSNVVLIGFMGAGKSSVSTRLAKRLHVPNIEMDELVLAKSERKTIGEIFATDGEQIFRAREQEVASELVNQTGSVISAGGGVVTNDETMKHLHDHAIVVLLKTSFATIVKRLASSTDRPLWHDHQKARTLFDLRQTLYARHADVVVDTDNKSVNEVVNEIISNIGGNI